MNNTDLTLGKCPMEEDCGLKKWVVFICNCLGVIVFIAGYPAMNIAYLRFVLIRVLNGILIHLYVTLEVFFATN